MMKKVLFMLAMLTCIFASCSDGGSEDPINPTPKPDDVKYEITIDSNIISNGLSFNAKAGENTISFTANANWTLTVASTTSGATWCKASATSGAKGSATVKFTVEENTDYEDRSVSVTIKAGTASKTFTITQKSADALLLTTSKFEVAQEGGNIEVEVKANIDYQMEISETAKGWISEASSRGLKSYKHTFTIANNEEAENREGEITFKSGDKVEIVNVYQAGGAILLLTQDEYTVGDAGEMITVEIKSNIEFGVQMPDVDWISDEASSRGMSSHTLNYYIAPNESYDTRSAEIIFFDKNSDLQDTLKVIQAQKDAIVISEKTYNVEAEGETIEVKLSANVDFEITMPDVEWIEQVSSRALTEHTLYFKVAENEGEDSRSAEIVFVNKESQLSETITINQNCKSLLALVQKEYSVDDAGETISVAIRNNIEYAIQMPDVDWITEVTASRSISTDTLKFVVAANEGYDSRSAEIIFYDKNCALKDTLKVIQTQKDAIVISQKTYDVKAEGETIEVKLSANVDFEITMPDVDWISQTESRALKEHTLYFKILENTNKESRNAEIIFKDKKSQLSEKITINQFGLLEEGYENGVVTVATAGTMKNLLGDDYLNITSLKIVGFINGDDIYNLRRMLGGSNFNKADWGKLATLDLSEAVIVEGGGWYCEKYSSQYYTANDEIGKYMFAVCANLKEIVLPNGITSIGVSAFSGCGTLTSIDIPNSVTSIKLDAFDSCDALTSVTISDLSAWCKINFDNLSSSPLCCGAKLYLNDQLLTELTIPGDITNIKNFAFYGCTSIEKVNISGGVTSIGVYAFSDCDALTSILIPNNVTLLYTGAFAHCETLTSVTIGNGVTSISESAFYNCDALTSIVIPDNVTSIGKTAFQNCNALTSVTIGNGVTSISESAFSICNALTSIVIPDNVTSIGKTAFQSCNALASITIGNGVTSISEGTFYNCDALTSIVIPDNVTSIGRNAFKNCDALTSIIIPDNVTSIGSGAFSNCNALTSITVGDGISEIPESLCYNCNNLNEVKIGKNVKSIGGLAFYIKDGYHIDKFYCYAALPPKFSNFKSHTNLSSTTYKYNYCYPFSIYSEYYKDANYGSNGKMYGTTSERTKIQTIYVPIRCGTEYKESDWKDFFTDIAEI